MKPVNQFEEACLIEVKLESNDIIYLFIIFIQDKNCQYLLNIENKSLSCVKLIVNKNKNKNVKS